MSFSDRISSFCSALGATVKSIVKIILQSRRNTITAAPQALQGRPVIIMGNGPSLAPLIESDGSCLAETVSMAVNFAANADEFTRLRPDFYLLADPHFFEGRETDPNVKRLFHRLDTMVDWPMTLYLPVFRSAVALKLSNHNIKVEHFNYVGAEGFRCFENIVFRSGLAMPRPRNVLVPAIMCAMQSGFRSIYIVGADHGWLQTLNVNERNELESVQPHFYKDSSEEHRRVASVYRNVRLHEMLLSMHLAFRSYHIINRYAATRGVGIYNSTPGSFIDAFTRRPLPWMNFGE